MDAWPEEHLERMRQGGNKAFWSFLQQNDIDLNALEVEEADIKNVIKQRYTSSAAELYKEILSDRVAVARGLDVDTSDSSSFAVDDDDVMEFAATTNSIIAAPSTSMTPVYANNENPAERDKAKQNDIPKDEAKEQHSESPLSLDYWLSKAPASASNIAGAVTDATSILLSNSIHSSNRGSITPKKTRIKRSLSCASTPTITYMGRSFNADSEEFKHLGKNSPRYSIHSIMSRADLAEKHEQLARNNNSDAPWRTSLPPNFWTAHKKVEPFDAVTTSPGNKRHSLRPSVIKSEKVRQNLCFTESDLFNVAMDENEFARLKAGLQSRGAVTNEVLKQKLYAFIAKSKQRQQQQQQQQRRSSDTVESSKGATTAEHEVLAHIPRRPSSRRDSDQQDRLGLAHTIHTSTLSRASHTF